MKCHNWQLDISSWLDEQLPADRVEAVKEHLNNCASCSAFYESQLRLDQILERAAASPLDPPAGIWLRIQHQLEAGETLSSPSLAERLLEWVRLPQYRIPAAAALLLMLTSGVVLWDWRNDLMVEHSLSELDAFRLEVTENPFFTEVETGNPFFDYEPIEPEGKNPFR